MDDEEPSLTRWIRVDQLERHLAIEPGVPCPVHLAERAAADSLEHAQVSPVRQRAAAIADRGRRHGRVVKRQTTMYVGESGQHPELGEHGPAGFVRARLGACPVDRRAIEHSACEIGNEVFTHGRGSFPLRAGRAPAPLSCVLLPATVCQGPRQARRRCIPSRRAR